MTYNHTQHAPLHWILTGVAAIIASIAIALSREPGALIILIPISCLMFLLARCFAILNVSDQSTFLSVRFGPIPLFGTTIDYAEIEDVEPSKSSVLDGWGVHWLPGRGWIYNLWGFACVSVRMKDKTVRIGTDDVDGLIAFLKAKIDQKS